MSFLAWLYVLGAGAVAFPLVLHLIRRTPRGSRQFSSLMFLKESPPQLTKRSRLDNLLLLLLRALAIILLALAFMRPFWRTATNDLAAGIRGRRIAIVIDTSASMRRADLWSQALKQANAAIDSLQPQDDVGLFTFDDRLVSHVTLGDEAGLKIEQKADLIRQRLTNLEPTWRSSDLGAAMISVAEMLEVTNDRQEEHDALQLVLISDMQQGAQRQALQTFEWPKSIQVDVRPVVTPARTNASLQIVERGEDEQPTSDNSFRVRVHNSEDSADEQFYVRWSTGEDDAGADRDDAVAFHVPAGQSRVLDVSRDNHPSADRLLITGDEDEFDNEFFVVPPERELVQLVYVGSDDAEDPQGLSYYLSGALLDTAQREVRINITGEESLHLTPDELPRIVVVGEQATSEQLAEVEQYAREGGTVLAVLRDVEVARSLEDLLTGVEIRDDAPPAELGDYAMLGEIDFSHPVLLAFAGASFGDFTKIHFWQHRQVVLSDDVDVHVLARFDNGSPALWEQPLGDGKVFVLSSGWHPADSQLARSSKFVMLMGELLEHASGAGWESAEKVVGQSISLPSNAPNSTSATVTTPDGTELPLAAGESFTQTDTPGIYEIRYVDETHRVAVNLAREESDTLPIDAEQLEDLGVSLGQQATHNEVLAREQQKRDVELESNQQIWRWLIVAAIAVLIFETWLAGRRARMPAPSVK